MDPQTLVVVATNGGEHLPGCLERLVDSLHGEDAALEVAGYNDEPVDCGVLDVIAECERHSIIPSVGFCSFAGAVNRVLAQWSEARDLPPEIVVIRDDAMVAGDWLAGLRCALATEHVILPDDPLGILRPVSEYGRIGLVGPCSDKSRFRSQRVLMSQDEADMGLDTYAEAKAAHHGGLVSVADAVDDFCLMASAGLIAALSGQLLDPDVGNYGAADLAVRARQAGYQAVVAESAFVSRVIEQPLHHMAVGQADDRLAYYRKHVAAVEPVLAGCWVAWIETAGDLHLFRQSIARACCLVDRVSVALANNPLDMVTDPEYRQMIQRGMFGEDVIAMMEAANGADHAGVAAAFEAWVRGIATGAVKSRVTPEHVTVRCWPEGWNGRALRDLAAEGARAAGAGWALGLDGGDMLEPRVTRATMDRLMAHPDPLVRGWDLATLTHWDGARLVREDPPWGDGGRNTGGPHGVRLWRLDGAPNHMGGTAAGWRCGHAPPVGPDSRRVANVRVRDGSLVRPGDRSRRLERMACIDPEPDERLTGGPWGHSYLLAEDGMRLSPLQPLTGVGLHMLCYSGEEPEDVARILDRLHGLVDRAVIVWTENSSDVPAGFQEVLDAFGAETVHHPLDDDLSAARNAGLNELSGTSGMGWALFLDPDEWLREPEADVAAMRRMAEAGSRYGYLFRVANYRGSGGTSESESVRMSRLDEGGIMRMNGRVHEGFEAASEALIASGTTPAYGYAPFVLQHRGLSGDGDGMRAKLDRYDDLLRLELADNPRSVKAWVTLSWNYRNNGHEAEAVECLQRAIAADAGSAVGSFLPLRELGLHHLRTARALLSASRTLLVDHHSSARMLDGMLPWLAKYAPDPPTSRHRQGEPAPPLPDFPLEEIVAGHERDEPAEGTIEP